jgi:hypothetical protein
MSMSPEDLAIGKRIKAIADRIRDALAKENDCTAEASVAALQVSASLFVYTHGIDDAEDARAAMLAIATMCAATMNTSIGAIKQQIAADRKRQPIPGVKPSDPKVN